MEKHIFVITVVKKGSLQVFCGGGGGGLQPPTLGKTMLAWPQGLGEGEGEISKLFKETSSNILRRKQQQYGNITTN